MSPTGMLRTSFSCSSHGMSLLNHTKRWTSTNTRQRHVSTELYLKINLESNPVVKEIQEKYGAKWYKMPIVRSLPPTLNHYYIDALCDIAAQKGSFSLSLQHPFRNYIIHQPQHSNAISRGHNLYSVSIRTSSSELEFVKSRFNNSCLQIAIKEGQRLRWTSSIRQIWNVPHLSVRTRLGHVEAYHVLGEVNGLCENGAGVIKVESFLL